MGRESATKRICSITTYRLGIIHAVIERIAIGRGRRLRRHVTIRGHDMHTIHELLGHKDVATTMIYTHVLNRGGWATARC